VEAELTLTITEQAPLEAVGAAVRGCAMGNGLDAERATRLQVVVEELCREARLREEVDGDGVLDISVFFDGSTITVEVVDQRLPLTSLESRHLPSRRLLGLGFVDQLHVHFSGAAGNHARVEVSLGEHRAAIGDEILGPDAPDATDAEADGIVIRSIQHGDIIGLIRCIYRCYGYTYPDPAMYEARHVRRLLDTGRMHSVVAVLGEEVVGHCALVFERASDPVPEAGRMIVDPRFRGHHLAERMAELRNEVAKSLGTPGVYANCVTNHAGSQVTAFRRGAVEVGLVLGEVDAGTQMQGLASATRGRKSLLSLYNVTGEVSHREVSVPEHLGVHISGITERLGIPRALRHDVAPSDQAKTKFTSANMALAKVSEVKVSVIGADLIDRLRDELETEAIAGTVLTIVDLPATSPACAWAALELERLGLSFSCFLPEFADHGDVLRLQRFADLTLDVDHIVCGRTEGEVLRDFVIDEWRRVTKAALLGR